MKIDINTSIPGKLSVNAVAWALFLIFYYFEFSIAFPFLIFNLIMLYAIPNGNFIYGKWWMAFGALLGRFLAPVVIKILYFLIVAPIFWPLKYFAGVKNAYLKGGWKKVSQDFNLDDEY